MEHAAYTSYFDGGGFPYFLIRLSARTATLLTLGLAYPWAYCLQLRWEVDHTVVDGHRLCFDGQAREWWPRWLFCWVLLLFSLGLYRIRLRTLLRRWSALHLHIPQGPSPSPSHLSACRNVPISFPFL